jgi:hypothetical protein
MTVSDDRTESVPVKRLLQVWAVIMLLVAIGAYLLGRNDAFGTIVDIFVPATVVVSFGVLAWKYEIEN